MFMAHYYTHRERQREETKPHVWQIVISYSGNDQSLIGIDIGSAGRRRHRRRWFRDPNS